MKLSRPRATGIYAFFEGREFHAATSGDLVILRVYAGEPDAEGFTPSRIRGVQGTRTVLRDGVALTFVASVCRWRGEPFMIVGVDGTLADVFYTGARGEWAVRQPGMVRTGKLETHGRIPTVELTDIHELVNPIKT